LIAFGDRSRHEERRHRDDNQHAQLQNLAMDDRRAVFSFVWGVTSGLHI
jgi:hypothetical protein